VRLELSATPRTASWDFGEGELIVPGRQALSLLGGGERSEAWLAWDDQLHALVVAKLLRPNLVDDPRATAAMAREADALKQLAHPSIVRCFGAVLEGARPHLVLESLDGPRLSTLLRRYGPLASEQVVPLAIEIGSALQFMHNAGYVHLDVKPRNVIMGAAPKLIDLGIARRFSEIPSLTSPLGTDAYMAPEQTSAATVSALTAAADVWGLSVLLYEAIEGRLPFRREGDGQARPFPQLSLPVEPFRREVHPEVATAIYSGLQRDPAARPPLRDTLATFESLLPAARMVARRRLNRRVR
jgi:serine/threonine protein kinase